MYIILIFENENFPSFLNKDKKVIAILDESAMFDTFSEANSKAHKCIQQTRVISAKEFLLSDFGNKAFINFCLTVSK